MTKNVKLSKALIALLAALCMAACLALAGCGGSSSSDGTITITDSTAGSSMTFTASNNSDGTITFNMGDEIGTATVAKVDQSDFSDAINAIVEGTTAIQ